MNCKNCNNIVKGNYCSNCGQSTKIERLTLKSLAVQITESIFLVNRGFLFTIKALTIKPGEAIRNFLDGKRQNHYKPIPYLILLSTVYFFLSKLVDGSTLIDSLVDGFLLYESPNEVESSSFDWFRTNFAYATLLLIPVFSLATFLSFRSHESNYVEHLVLNAYITGQQTIIYSFFMLLGFIFSNDEIGGYSLPFAILYLFWVFWQFFKQGSRFSIILRSLLTYMIYMFMVSLLAFLVV